MGKTTSSNLSGQTPRLSACLWMPRDCLCEGESQLRRVPHSDCDLESSLWGSTLSLLGHHLI